MTQGTHHIMLVDDHAIARRGLREIFEDSIDIVVACEAENGQQALSLIREREVDGVLLDLSLPDRSGMDVLRHMRHFRPTLPILIVSMHNEEQYAISMLKAGANGFVSKGCAPAEILHATRLALSGRRHVSPAVAQQLATAFVGGGADPPHERLSTREFEVFCKLAMGVTVSGIASEIFISEKTVSKHRLHILEKMNMRTNADLTYYAIKNALIA